MRGVGLRRRILEILKNVALVVASVLIVLAGWRFGIIPGYPDLFAGLFIIHACPLTRAFIEIKGGHRLAGLIAIFKWAAYFFDLEFRQRIDAAGESSAHFFSHCLQKILA